MREIEFRVYHQPSNKIYEVSYLRFGKSIMVTNSLVGILKWKDCKLLEYSGLKDKNGKKIYEGDVIKIVSNMINIVTNKPTGKISITIHFVEFKEAKFKLNDDPWSLSLTSCKKFYEVVGNIHDNPELINHPAVGKEE